jgi:hypothetical protein
MSRRVQLTRNRKKQDKNVHFGLDQWRGQSESRVGEEEGGGGRRKWIPVGMCWMSKMNKPWVYLFLLDNLTDPLHFSQN